MASWQLKDEIDTGEKAVEETAALEREAAAEAKQAEEQVEAERRMKRSTAKVKLHLGSIIGEWRVSQGLNAEGLVTISCDNTAAAAE